MHSSDLNQFLYVGSVLADLCFADANTVNFSNAACISDPLVHHCLEGDLLCR